MIRRLNFANSSNVALERNSAHLFAQRHTLNIYDKNAIYTYIPKNACSTLRLSLAIANGCIESVEQFEWIHQNNETFVASLAQVLQARFTFTILRCPFRRVASAFLDKLVSKDRVAWAYYDVTDKKVELDNLSFEKFIRSIRNTRVLNSNHHWRPQSDFMMYENYDGYFSVEKMENAVKTLSEKIGFNIVDARSKTLHGSERYEKIEEGDFSKIRSSQLYSQKLKGRVPNYKLMYTDDLIEKVAKIYSDDITLYKRVCDESDLLFTI